MKYVLFAHYAGFDMDDPEDFVNNSWFIGETTDPKEAKKMAKKEIDDYIEGQVFSRFDNPDDYEGAEKEELLEEIKDFVDYFETSITRIKKPSEKQETLATLHFDHEYYFEDLKVEVIKLDE